MVGSSRYASPLRVLRRVRMNRTCRQSQSFQCLLDVKQPLRRAQRLFGCNSLSCERQPELLATSPFAFAPACRPSEHR